MGTARMMTLGVVAIGAGAFLAMSVIPAFAPYQKSKADGLASLVAAPEASEEQPVADAHPFTPAQHKEAADQGFGLAMRDGDLVVHLPRWAADGGELLSFGERAWRDWTGPAEDTGTDRRAHEDDGYAAQPHRRADRDSYGRRQRFEQSDDEDAGSSEDDYAPRQRWNGRQERQSPEEYADTAGADDDGSSWSRRDSSDAAASAAERARAAARDVHAAEDTDQ